MDDLLAVSHAAHADVPLAVADGITLQRGIDRETVILVRHLREPAHRPEVEQRQTGDSLVAKLVGDADLGRLGEDVEAGEPLPGLVAQRPAWAWAM